MQVTLDERTATVAPEETARRLGVKQSTLANWRSSGRGPRWCKVVGRARYRLHEIAVWLDAQTRTSTSDPGR